MPDRFATLEDLNTAFDKVKKLLQLQTELSHIDMKEIWSLVKAVLKLV